LKLVATEQNQNKKKLAKEKEAVEVIAKKLNEAAPIVIKAKGGENGLLFGAITHQQISDAITSTLKLDVDKRRIMVKNLKEVGLHEVPVRMTFGVNASVKIKVEIEIEKKEDDKTETKRRKPRKKEEILAELEPEQAEVAVEPKKAKAKPEAEVVAEEATAEPKPKKARAKKEPKADSKE